MLQVVSDRITLGHISVSSSITVCIGHY